MTIEKSLERIADALEFSNRYQGNPDKVKETAARIETPISDDYKDPAQLHAAPDPSPQYTDADLKTALEQFIPERREEAAIIMNKFGVAKRSDVQPEMFAGLIQELNAVYHS